MGYAYYGGVYYLPATDGDGYVIVQPPIGILVDAPPPECAIVEVGEFTYCYHYGSYYQWQADSNKYMVVAPPVGAVVTYLPATQEVRYYEGTKYHFFSNVYYRPIYRGSDLVYQVVRPPV